MVSAPFNTLWREYDEWFEKHRNLYLNELKAIELASKSAPKPWLEVGVGTARFASPIGIEFGIDPSTPMLDIARLRGVDVATAIGEELPFRSKSFGSVFMVVTLCFLDNPTKALCEAYRVLVDGGKLIVGFVPLDSDWGRHYQRLKEQGHRFYRFARFYTVDEALDLLRSSGFLPELYISTLRLSKPGGAEVLENPIPGLYRDAGFVVVRASKA